MKLRYGLVVEAHPDDHSVDVIMTDDHSRLTGVQVLSYNGGPDVGTADMFCPEVKSGEAKWDLARRTADDLKAAILFEYGSMPIVIGFLYPQIGQMTFPDKNRRVQRHSSDVYSTVDNAGNMEVAFPNGTFFRVGTTPDHEDLTGKDFDKKWAIKKNTGKATHVRLVLGNSGAVKFDFHADPDGNVAVTAQGTCTLNIVGDTVVNTAKATVNASEGIELATPLVHCTEALTVSGLITGEAGLKITGSMTNNGKNVGDTHKHSGITRGGAQTDPVV